MAPPSPSSPHRQRSSSKLPPPASRSLTPHTSPLSLPRSLQPTTLAKSSRQRPSAPTFSPPPPSPSQRGAVSQEEAKSLSVAPSHSRAHGTGACSPPLA